MTLQTNLLQGEKVYLTAQTKDDQPKSVAWWNYNPDYVRLLTTDMYKPFTLEQAEDWYSNLHKRDNFITFAIRTLQNNEFIGFVSIAQINWQAQHCMVGIGIGNTDYWGKGYGSDAMRILLRYCFMEMNMNRVGLVVTDYNKRAIKSYEKVGFIHEGAKRQLAWRDGQFYDVHHMATLRKEWINDTAN